MRFKHFFYSAVILAVLLAAVTLTPAQSGRARPAATPPPNENDPVKIETEEIKLNVLAFNNHGEFIRDVSVDDLVIRENDVLHQATSVRRIPANVLIVMDTGGEMRSKKTLKQTQKTAMAVVSSLRPEDSVAVLQYADRADIILEWTTDRDAAKRAIRNAKFGRRSVFVSALFLAGEFLSKNNLENRHLVLITDGTDSSATREEKDEAMRGLLSTEINVHVISYAVMETIDIQPRTRTVSNTPPPKAMPDEVVAQLPNGVRQSAQAPRVGPTINLDRKLLAALRERQADLVESGAALESLADNANGTLISPENHEEMLQKAPLVAKYIDSSYVVTYTPKTPLSELSGVRDISVTSRREGLIAQARRKLIVKGTQ